MANKDLPKLLRAIAAGAQAKENGHDVILTAAADELEWRRAEADEINIGRYMAGSPATINRG